MRCGIYDAHDAAAATLLVAADVAGYAWRRLVAAGAGHGLRVGGHLAEEALRIAAGRPGFGREATPARRLEDLGLARAAEAPAPVPKTYRPRRLVKVACDLATVGFGEPEAILAGGRAVGELTSRVRLPGWPRTLGLALIDPATPDDVDLEVVAGGRRWRLESRPDG